MIVFVDYEHEEARDTAWGEKVLAARTWITYRLEDLAGVPCMLVRYNRVTPELLDRLDARAVFISGNSADPARYDAEELAPLHAIITDGDRPVFGFCGGFQCIADALGTTIAPINTSAIDEKHPEHGRLVPFGAGPGEFGYHSVDLVADHPLLGGLGPAPVVRHAHRLEVPSLPDGFQRLASSAITPNQMAVNDQRRLAGTQFHPEYYTDEHTAGRMLIENALRWAGVTP